MCARDPNVYLNSSQSIQKTLLHIKALYQHSPVSVCVRNDMHEILYANASYQQLKEFLSYNEKKQLNGVDSYDINLFLSQLELDCFFMGTGCVLSSSFECSNRKFQIRMECREFQGESSIVLWFVSLCIPKPFVNGIRRFTDSDRESKVSRVIDKLSNKNLSAFSFYILGFSCSEISAFLNANERAIRRRIELSKAISKNEYASLNMFRLDCFKTGKIKVFVNFAYEYLNVI